MTTPAGKRIDPSSIAQALPESEQTAAVGNAAAARVQPMDARTLAALRNSIEKWKLLEAGLGEDRGPDNCALCKEFRTLQHEGYGLDVLCYGCPVFAATGQHACRGTPYEEWENAEQLHDDKDLSSEELKPFARAEREFLESLLPVAPK